MKLKLKFLIAIFAIFMLLLSTFSLATNSNNDIMLISNGQTLENNLMDSDLYIGDEQYNIKNIINGNVFASVNVLNIDPNDNGGIIEGNLFAVADNVNIKSVVTYSDTEQDDLGNPAISIDKYCTISGNAFVTANKFVLEPGSKIYGDLFVCANEIELSQGSTIYGNVFIVSNKLTLNSEIGGSLYASVKSFDMQYFGVISRDLHLTTENATLNGYIYRNSFIEGNNITTNNKFVNQKDFNITDANSLIFSGEVDGNATINAKKITLMNKENDSNLTCKISGNLAYSSKQEINIPEGIVSGETSYSNYTSTSSKSVLSNIWNYILSLITSLVCIYVVYFIISKFTPNYLERFSDISVRDLLKYLGIGLLILLVIPIISILLLISNIGSILGLLLILIYIIILLVSKSIFVISIATFIKNKLQNNFNSYLYILAITVILSLISLIPFLGFIIVAIVNLIGFGMITKNLISRKK